MKNIFFFLAAYAVVGILAVLIESRRYRNTWIMIDKTEDADRKKIREISKKMWLIWNDQWLTDYTAVNYILAAFILILYPISMIYVECKIVKTRRALKKLKR